MLTELPPLVQHFLQTSEGRRARTRVRTIVHAFHHWLDQRQLTLSELTPDHLEQFFARFRDPAVPKRTSCGHRQLARAYMLWLHDRALISFDPVSYTHLRA